MQKNEKTTPNAKPKFELPSAYDMAMLAATMKAGPEAALRLWYESKLLKECIEEMDERRRGVLFCGFCRALEDDGFSDEDHLQGFSNAMHDEIRYTVDESMKMLDIFTKKTFFELVRYHLNRKPRKKVQKTGSKSQVVDCSEEEKQQAIEKEFRQITLGRWVISESLLSNLKKAKRDKRAEIARQNKVNACHTRKPRKPVK